MMEFITNLVAKTEQWPGIYQGAVGSFIFWSALEIIRYFVNKVQVIASKKPNRENLLQEFIYRKYTCRDGFIPMSTGLLLSFSYTLKYLVLALLFTCLAFLIAGMSDVIKGVNLITAIYFLIKSLLWIVPRWQISDMYKNWQRVGELENLLFGKIDDDTKKALEELSSKKAKNN